MLRTHQGGVVMAPNQPDDMVAIANEPLVYVLDERNHLREAKHKRDVLSDYFDHVGALAGQRRRERRSWHLPVLFRTTQLFKELLFKLVLHKCPPKFPTNFPKMFNRFPTILQYPTKSQVPLECLITSTQFFDIMSHIKYQNF